MDDSQGLAGSAPEMVDSTSDDRTANNVMRHAHRVLSDEEKDEMQAVKDLGLKFHDLLGVIGNSREISIDMAQEVLQDLLRANDRHVTIDDIQKRVCEHYNIKMSDLLSPRRARAVARPRQVAMYLAKQITTLSLPQIGKRFGNRDHTTVMHAVRKIEELKVSDLSIAEDVELLKRQLQG